MTIVSRREKFEELRQKLCKISVTGMTVSNVERRNKKVIRDICSICIGEYWSCSWLGSQWKIVMLF